MTEHDLDWLRAGLAADASTAVPRLDCPEPTEIWAAARGQLERAQIAKLTDHVGQCPACVEAWRLALAVAPQHLEGSQKPAKIRRYAPWMSIAAGLILVFGLQLHKRSNGPATGTPGSSPTDYSAVVRQDAAHEPLKLESPRALPRDNFLLEWSGPEGARYQLRLLDTRADLLLEQKDLRQTRFLVPSDRLTALPDGAALTCTIVALHPASAARLVKSFTISLLEGDA